ISQLLKLLRETVASPDRERALQLGDPQDPGRVPGYDELAHGRDAGKELGFGLGWSLERARLVQDPISGQRVSGDAMRFDARLGADRNGQPPTLGFRYALEEAGREQLSV